MGLFTETTPHYESNYNDDLLFCKHCDKENRWYGATNGPHISAYCIDCFKWIKHLSTEQKKNLTLVS